jgi:hypothetical protein
VAYRCLVMRVSDDDFLIFPPFETFYIISLLSWGSEQREQDLLILISQSVSRARLEDERETQAAALWRSCDARSLRKRGISLRLLRQRYDWKDIQKAKRTAEGMTQSEQMDRWQKVPVC